MATGNQEIIHQLQKTINMASCKATGNGGLAYTLNLALTAYTQGKSGKLAATLKIQNDRKTKDLPDPPPRLE